MYLDNLAAGAKIGGRGRNGAEQVLLSIVFFVNIFIIFSVYVQPSDCIYFYVHSIFYNYIQYMHFALCMHTKVHIKHTVFLIIIPGIPRQVAGHS